MKFQQKDIRNKPAVPAGASNVDDIPNIPDIPMPAGMVAEENQPVKGSIGTASQQQMRNRFSNTSSLSTSKDIDVGMMQDGWTSLEFPSRMIAYDVDDIQVKPINVGILSRVHAAQQAKSFSLLIDAIQNCCNYDLRALTVPDFYYFMYWLRINSYPKSPLKVNWTSKYGNANSTITRMSHYDIKELEMTKEEYFGYLERGLCFPTIRETEYSMENEDTLPEDEKWLIGYAQYIYVEDNKPDHNYIKRKIEHFKTLGNDILTDIEEFSSKMEHGVIEQVRVSDEKFELESAIKHMREEIETTSRLIEQAAESGELENIRALGGLAQHIDKRIEEVEALEKALEEGIEVTPDEEVVDIGVADATLLFP